jgi:hypothetical protein
MNVSMVRRSITAVARFMAVLLLLLHGPIELAHASHHVKGKLTNQSITLGFITGDDHCPICDIAAQDSTFSSSTPVTFAEVIGLRVQEGASDILVSCFPLRARSTDSRGPPSASSSLQTS